MNSKPAKIVGILSYLAGLVLIVAGIATWVLITTNLAEQRITVARDSPTLAGAPVAGPFTAFAEAQIINEHAVESTGGKTYAELGAAQTTVKQQAADAGIKDIASTDPAVVAQDSTNPAYRDLKAQYEQLTAQRDTAMNGSFLRASLFTSVVAYGVSALVIGLGVMFLLLGWAMRSLAAKVQDTTAGSGRSDADRVTRTADTRSDDGGATAAG